MTHAVLFTESRREAWAVDNLAQAGFEAKFPMLRVKMVRRYKCHIRLPALSRYIFVRIEPEMPWSVIEGVSGVIGAVKIAGRPCEIQDCQVDELFARIAKLNSDPASVPYEVGDFVCFSAESLWSGFVAQVQRIDNKFALVDIVGTPETKRIRIAAHRIARASCSPALGVSLGLYR